MYVDVLKTVISNSWMTGSLMLSHNLWASVLGSERLMIWPRLPSLKVVKLGRNWKTNLNQLVNPKRVTSSLLLSLAGFI